MSADRRNPDRAVINCLDADWRHKLHSQLYRGAEVDLINFDYDSHGESCELIAQAFTMQFRLNRLAEVKAAHFRKKPGWRDLSRGVN